MQAGKISIAEFGKPDVMQWVGADTPDLKPDEILVSHEAIGVDFIDILMRSGQMKLALPMGLGFAAAGTIAKVGADVTGLRAGDRVSYMCLSAGSYATQRAVPAARAYKLPDQDMPAELAAGALFKGLTAWYLATRLKTIKPGDVALLHAAAGGVGLILLQWLKSLGAVVVGTVSSRDKVAMLKKYGCDEVVVLPEEDFVERVNAVSKGKGAEIVFESVGKKTFDKSLEAARRFGMVVSYGWPSGDPDPVPLMSLRAKSLFLTRPTVTQYTEAPEDFQAGAKALFDLIAQGKIAIEVGTSFPLRDAARAHAAMESGKTIGSVVLTVQG